MTTSAPIPSVASRTACDAVGGRRVHVAHALVAEEVAREVEALRRRLQHQDAPGALEPGDEGMGGADRSGADHHHRVVE